MKVCGVPVDDWANGGYVHGLFSGADVCSLVNLFYSKE